MGAMLILLCCVSIFWYALLSNRYNVQLVFFTCNLTVTTLLQGWWFTRPMHLLVYLQRQVVPPEPAGATLPHLCVQRQHCPICVCFDLLQQAMVLHDRPL